MHWIRTIAWIALAASLAGCASKPATALREGLRMVDLYRGSAAEEAGATDAARAESREPTCGWWLFRWPCDEAERVPETAETTTHERSYTRTAANELELLFPRLPNPDIYIHVLPHLATESRVPVPGYTTAVPLYPGVEYALPGETGSMDGDVPNTGAAP